VHFVGLLLLIILLVVMQYCSRSKQNERSLPILEACLVLRRNHVGTNSEKLDAIAILAREVE
jgi:hypothetical protein